MNLPSMLYPQVSSSSSGSAEFTCQYLNLQQF